MDGTVRWFNIRKGYGFIKGDDEKDYFVHHSSLTPGTVLHENDLVTFEPTETDKGNQAQNVALKKK